MNPTDFSSIYRGLEAQCCCGCSGVHIPDTDRRRFLHAFKRLKALTEAGNPGFTEPDFIVVVDDRGVYQYIGYRK